MGGKMTEADIAVWIGNLWQIRIGSHAGAREDGVSLARDMRELAGHNAET
jgi:hypothetical protein